jgi:hypothetical protein
VGYHPAVRGPDPPSLHPSNEPGPQTFAVAPRSNISVVLPTCSNAPEHSKAQTKRDAPSVSDEGDDKNDGLSPEAPVKSLKRLCILWSGRQLVLMEGRETFNRLVDEMVVFVRFAKAELKNEKRVSEHRNRRHQPDFKSSAQGHFFTP